MACPPKLPAWCVGVRLWSSVPTCGPATDSCSVMTSRTTTWYLDLFEKHAKSPGHRLVLTQEDDSVTGYAWGYTGQRGQYWSDLLCDSLPEPIASQWVGGHFDVVELAVLPTHRRRGLGQALHDCLLEDVTGRCLLGTSSDPDGPAVRLYTRSGWRTLGTLRTGMQVMGLDRA